MNDTDEIKKLYWKIGEVADQLGVETSFIRYYQGLFNLPCKKRNKHKDRIFTAAEIVQLKQIVALSEVFKLAYIGRMLKEGRELGDLMFLTR